MALCRKKREPSQDEDTRRTWMSSFILFLIRYCFLPVSIENDKIIFKLLSWKTFIHCFVSFGYMTLCLALPLTSTSVNVENIYFAYSKTSFAINLSLTLVGLSNMSGLLLPLIISDGLTTLNATFIMNKNLRTPPKAYRIILGELSIPFIKIRKHRYSHVTDDDWFCMF